MRLCTVRVGDGTSVGRLAGDEIVLLGSGDVGAWLAAGADWRERAEAAGGERIAAGDADFAPLTPRPEKIVAVGVNYRDHAAEVNIPLPEHPTLFAKFARSLIGANDAIELPACSQAVDWEVELGVVVGSDIRNATPEQALAAVAGYTIVNDVSMRDWQLRTPQFLQGKTFEGSSPVGPWLVTPDEVDLADMRLTCSVNGQVMQDANTGDLIFGVAETLAYISQIITLVPGDLIATGTPAGIGAVRQPPVYLTDGDTVTTAIAGLGQQTNVCRAEALTPAS